MTGSATSLAAEQLGLVTHEQALAAGLSSSGIHRRVTSGQWERVQPGVYGIAGTPPSSNRSLLAACLSAGGLATISHRSAAAHWGLRLPDPSPLEISLDRERATAITGVEVHRSRDLSADHIVADGPLPVTTPARTLVDLGQVVPWYLVRSLLEHLLTSRLVTVDQARAALLLHSRRGRRGCGALRHVLDQRALLDRPADSVLEAAFADLCVAQDLPRPHYQFVIFTLGVARRIDFAYPELRLGIEVDGFETHATAVGFVSDRIRANELTLLGWTVLHFTWAQVIHQPARVAAIIRRALRLQEADPGHIQNWA